MRTSCGRDGRNFRMMRLRLLATLALVAAASAAARPPTIYGSRNHESPVHGNSDELLLLAGDGFAPDDTVVYRRATRVEASGQPRNALYEAADPPSVPVESTAESGIASVVSSTTHALTVKLPSELNPDVVYSLRVHTSAGEWSRAVTINDVRPLWFSPAYVRSSAATAGLPRELKVVGRNLAPRPGGAIRIRVSGPTTFTGEAILDAAATPAIRPYVARLRLPRKLPAGRYRVDVRRDDLGWRSVPDQTLEVLPDVVASPDFGVDEPRFGGCRADDGVDDTDCTLRAIAAAGAAGGNVYFGPGTWDFVDGRRPGVARDEGMVLPLGVGLRGAGSTSTRLARHAEWNPGSSAAAVFTLLGTAQVTGITFTDLQRYQPGDRAGPFLQLGVNADRSADARAAAPFPRSVADVIITDNTFDKVRVAVGSGGLPLNRVFITHNTFGAYHAALEFAGNGYATWTQFRIDDSIIAFNKFAAGSELNLEDRSGTLASEVGAGHRVDFSGNSADGADRQFLYSPEDAAGWRAAFFWNMNGNVEETLVSQNLATCTGDKVGDGEAFAFDNNANTFALPSVTAATAATDDSVTVPGTLVRRQNHRDLPVDRYYVGHWIQIVAGPGLGQVRKILGYSFDPVTRTTLFRITPDWDVLPVSGRTRLAVGREFWQVYVLDNKIDNRSPLCRKSNRSRHNAGVITMWGQNADSVIAGNHQYDSDGIFVQQIYILPEHPCADCNMESFFQSFLEIRDNVIDGEYDWSIDCSTSGIAVGAAAAPWNDPDPPTVGFGAGISHNWIRRADAQYSGAIAQLGTWLAGPAPHRWPLSENLLIQHNTLIDIDGPGARPECGKPRARAGISFPDDPIAWNTVLYANRCQNVPKPIAGAGVATTSLCPSPAPDSCECASRPPPPPP